ncbi:hypothetical protein Q8W71_11825 [Methylobacterium sp. NEAU 140]|uniref:hypothetical protein n=1 Tax=Methylobacterium sp. NEAU 140 TaxID=3064945 RepID=UPI00273252AE|nr:hypothetical protein [Methylobacterium sp. NEAU 140]MDP4023317.1 hypothetical protein [Methylobacterium sp. NEAU 140]
MPSRRRFTLPIDPWPRANLGERMAVSTVLMLLLLVPFCAVGAALVAVGLLTLYVYRSYDLGASLRALIDRRPARADAGRTAAERAAGHRPPAPVRP